MTNSALRNGIPYNLSVYARSAVSMRPSVQQGSFEPGATIDLAAELSQYDLPLSNGAQVRVEVTRPDGHLSSRTLGAAGGGTFTGGLATTKPGVYQLRFLGSGTTLGGTPFTREALRTVAVTPGADRPRVPPTGGSGATDDTWERICELVECLMADGQLKEVLAELGIDPDILMKCLERICRRRSPRPVPVLTATTVTDLTALLGRPDVRRLLQDPAR